MKALGFIAIGLVLGVMHTQAQTPTSTVAPKLLDNKNDKSLELRSFIGSTFYPPVSHKGKLYFVATTGVLYESDATLTSVNKLYMGKRQTLGATTLENGVVYWGEGLHSDNKSTLHAFDIAKKKVKDLEVDGHIERAPLIKDGVLYVGLGPAGVAAFKASTLAKIWETKTHDKLKLHVDGNLVAYGDKVCTTSVYDYKAIICLEAKTGKVVDAWPTKKSPKGEIALTDNLLIGFSTEADMTKGNWVIPADFYIIDLSTGKLRLEKELRGFNFFAPMVKEGVAYVSLSTGDFISINLADGKIGYLGEFQEPFINNTFAMKDSVCSLGVMGKLLCYSKGKAHWGISEDKRFMETPVGRIETIEGKIYAPSRVGYFLVD